MEPEGSHEITPDELRAKIFAPPTPEELERRRNALAEATRLRAKSKPLGFTTATLVRAARRETEVLYGGKTWEDLIAEES